MVMRMRREEKLRSELVLIYPFILTSAFILSDPGKFSQMKTLGDS
jgi:hypothetical protein